VAAKLPGAAGPPELQALAARLAADPLDPAHPLWQVHFVERYGTGSAWVLRVHHCYADGMAMVRVLLSLTEQDSGPALAGAAEPRRDDGAAARFGRLQPLVHWLDQVSQPASDILENALAEGARLLGDGVHRVFHPETTARTAVQAGGMIAEFARVLALPDDPPTPLRAQLRGRKRVAWTAPLDLAEVRMVARALDCSVNDVLMATLAGALGAHLREVHGLDTDGLVLRASMPMNLRRAEEPMALGNKFGLVFADLPVGVRNPLQRAFRMHDTLRALKGSLQPPMTLLTLGLMGMLPAAAQAPLVESFSRKGTVVASNVPGPQAALNLCGQRIEEMYFWVPQSGSIGIGASLLSYAGKVFFGLIADAAIVVDPQPLADRFGGEFEHLLLAATTGLLGLRESGAPHASRRKPRKSGVRPPSRTRTARRKKPPAAST
jgi:WS/DGAT/MGAT family acyltransferase